MDYKNVLDYQERLVKNYKYRPLPTMFSDEARAFYKENVPEGLCMDGANTVLFSPSGLKLCNGYNRIVVGDYGAYVEIMQEDMVHENIRTKPGQEYREEDPRYSRNVKYAWLTAKDDSDIKIYFQKKPVAYADYVPGRYYVSVYECVPSKVAEKGDISREEIADWLKGYGVFSDELADYYFDKVGVYGDVIGCAIAHNIPPYELEYWLCIHDVCQVDEGLSFNQYEAIAYNLNVIRCNGSELKGELNSLSPDVRLAIEMGLEGLEFPYEIQNLSSDMVRALLKMSPEALLCVSKFSKVIAGCKVENMEQVRDVGQLINEAKSKVSNVPSNSTERELEYV